MFKNVSAEVRKSTGYIALIVLIGSLLMEAVFLLIGKWDVTVLLGNLLGAAAAIVNFFIMALGFQKAADAGDPGDARKRTQLSYSLRLLALALVCVIGCVAPCFNPYAVVIPLLFPGVGAKLSGILMKSKD